MIIYLNKMLHHGHIVFIGDFFGVYNPIEAVLELIEGFLHCEGSIKLRVNLSRVLNCHADQVLESFEFFLKNFRLGIILLYHALL